MFDEREPRYLHHPAAHFIGTKSDHRDMRRKLIMHPAYLKWQRLYLMVHQGDFQATSEGSELGSISQKAMTLCEQLAQAKIDLELVEIELIEEHEANND